MPGKERYRLMQKVEQEVDVVASEFARLKATQFFAPPGSVC